jgi:hypothetical protein
MKFHNQFVNKSFAVIVRAFVFCGLVEDELCPLDILVFKAVEVMPPAVISFATALRYV